MEDVIATTPHIPWDIWMNHIVSRLSPSALGKFIQTNKKIYVRTVTNIPFWRCRLRLYCLKDYYRHKWMHCYFHVTGSYPKIKFSDLCIELPGTLLFKHWLSTWVEMTLDSGYFYRTIENPQESKKDNKKKKKTKKHTGT